MSVCGITIQLFNVYHVFSIFKCYFYICLLIMNYYYYTVTVSYNLLSITIDYIHAFDVQQSHFKGAGLVGMKKVLKLLCRSPVSVILNEPTSCCSHISHMSNLYKLKALFYKYIKDRIFRTLWLYLKTSTNTKWIEITTKNRNYHCFTIICSTYCITNKVSKKQEKRSVYWCIYSNR